MSCAGIAFSQQVEQGPMVGAVSTRSATVLFFTDKDCRGELQLAFDTTFKYILSFPFESSADTRHVVKIKLDSLQALTQYYYRVVIGNTTDKQGSFHTFPVPYAVSNLTLAFGSCMENFMDDAVFREIDKHSPDLFLQLGDWNYPAHAYYPGKPGENQHRFFTSREDEIFLSYQVRYLMPNLRQFLWNTPVDYVFDDEDGIWDDFSRTTYTNLVQYGKATTMQEIPYADSLRDNLLQSYYQFFPAYEKENWKEGAYHSYVYGNTEIFFLDTRSTRSPNTEIFYQTKNGKWKYKVPPGHHILDSAQLQWLLNGLKNSKADWKILVSGTNFNADFKKVLDICMVAQDRVLPNKMTGAMVAGALSAMWFAYPETQGALINFCHDNRIKNVFVLSGDAHTSAIDDGKHSGFPELMSGNLAQSNTQFASIIKNDLRLNLWDKGGQGIKNDNFNDAFGKVQVFGSDSVRLSCIDKYGTEISHYILKDGFIPKKYPVKRHTKFTFGNKLRAVKNMLKIGIHHLFRH